MSESDHRAPRLQGGEGGGRTALVVVDMLNTYEHEDADRLAEGAASAVPSIRRLLDRAAEEETRVIYVNDNYGDWNVSAAELADRAMQGAHPELVEPILPPDEVDFIVKARHTVFYMTPLEYLLDQGEVTRLVLTGQVTEQCILYSALDAYVRHFQVAVPRDAVAPIHEDLAEAALKMMERNMSVELADAESCGLD